MRVSEWVNAFILYNVYINKSRLHSYRELKRGCFSSGGSGVTVFSYYELQAVTPLQVGREVFGKLFWIDPVEAGHAIFPWDACWDTFLAVFSFFGERISFLDGVDGTLK